MGEKSDYGLIWLESWLVCCDNSLANFLLCSEFGSDQDSRSFLAQFKRAKQSAVQNMKDRKMNHCDRASHKHGKDKRGYQRYRCPVCFRTFSDNPEPKKAGRKPIGEKPMTAAERKRKQRSMEKL